MDMKAVFRGGLFGLCAVMTSSCQILDLSFLSTEKAPDQSALALLLVSAAGGLTGSSSAGPSCTGGHPPAPAFLADTVTSAPGSGGGGSYDDPARATNGICGAGSAAGSVDVYSLSLTGSRSTMTLEWAGKKVTNGTGIDFVVFENPFRVSGQSQSIFVDPLLVEVSQDGTSFCGFAPDYTNAPETTYSFNPAHWLRFAGKTPVLYNVQSNPLAADAIFDPAQAGGDGFDLADLSDSNAFGTGCDSTLANSIRTSGFVYVRLTAAAARTNPDTGAAFVVDAVSNGPDIDGVVARHLADR